MDNHSSRLPEKLRPSNACSHKSTIWREDSVSCNLSSQSSRTPSRPSKRRRCQRNGKEMRSLRKFTLFDNPL